MIADWLFSKISLLKEQAIIKAQGFGLLSVKLTDRVNDEIALHPPFDTGAKPESGNVSEDDEGRGP